MNFKHRIFLLTVVVAFAIITTAFVTMMTGKEIIMDSQSYAAEKRVGRLADELLKEYDDSQGYDTYIGTFFNDKNETHMVCAIDDNGNEILEIHINFMQISLHEPVSSLTPELNKMFEMDTEEFVRKYCEEKHIDHETTPVSELKGEELFDMIEALQEETGVQL